MKFSDGWVKGYSITGENVKIRCCEILKVNLFSRPSLERNCMHESVLIENISFSRNFDIKITQCTDAPIWVKIISIK